MEAEVILVGVAGYGAWHYSNILRLQDESRVKLTAIVDPIVKSQLTEGNHYVAPLFSTLSEAILTVGSPRIVVASIPTHLHASITNTALRAGADVLLEKPPFARMKDLDVMRAVEQETGRVVQVGFQSLGSLAMEDLKSGVLGTGRIEAVRAIGTWSRARSYYTRSQWVGRRSIGDFDVMDGVTTNALAHAVITALHIAGAYRAADIDRVEVEAYRSNPIDTDDTTSLRITLADGPVITAGLTLSAAEQTPPSIEVVGERGTVIFHYLSDTVTSSNGSNSLMKQYDRVDLLENLLSFREGVAPLLVPLAVTESFMRVVEAIHDNGEPVHISPKWITMTGGEGSRRAVVVDVEDHIAKAVKADSLFSEVNVPWAFTGKDRIIAHARVHGRRVLHVLDGAGTHPFSSPRPFLHPVSTLGGVEVTAKHPADHDWHLGAGFAIPDVNGTNFWGGATYVRDQGYLPLENQGNMKTQVLSAKVSAADDGIGGLAHVIDWFDCDNHRLLRENQDLGWSPLACEKVPAIGKSGWELAFRSTLTAIERSVSLGSPGTNGRLNAGYGGFFWRFPRCSDVTIMSAEAVGEDAVHGAVSQWLGWSARFEARPGVTGEATLVFVADDSISACDPWIARHMTYPGVGSAIAWDERLVIRQGESVSRGFRIAILDGRLDREGMEALASLILTRSQDAGKCLTSD